MLIEFTKTRDLANRRRVVEGEAYDIDELGITEEDARAYIENGIAKEVI